MRLSPKEGSDDEASPSPETSTPMTPTYPSSPDTVVIQKRLALFSERSAHHDLAELQSTPIFTETVRQRANVLSTTSSGPTFSQYGVLANQSSSAAVGDDDDGNGLVYYNVAAPSSTFICGSQGSGKSHTLSCLLENCLIASDAAELPRPLTGIVFHYDTFISDAGGSPCEAAFLSTHPGVKVRVLCAPTNVTTMRTTYARFANVQIEELRINETDLNTKRMSK